MEENKKQDRGVSSPDMPEAEVEVRVIDDRDEKAESLIHWAAARAGVIVATPMLGSVALMANEVYMISKIGSIYGVDISQKAVISFIGSLGATMLGMTVATLIPISFIQIPLGVSITYGLGQAALKWIKDGMPDDTRPYKAVFEEAKAEGKERLSDIEADEKKDIPLGDEKMDFTKEEGKMTYSKKAHDLVDKLAENVSDVVGDLGDKAVKVLKEHGVTDEQIDNVKYTALGAAEVAKEAATKAGQDLQALAKEKSEAWKKEITEKASDMQEQAKVHMEELLKKKEELKEQAKAKSEELKKCSEMQAEEAKVKADELKEQAKVHMEEAKAKAEELKGQAKEHIEKLQDKAGELRAEVEDKVGEVKKNATAYAEDFYAKTKERAAQKEAEDKKKN